ncbi:MAG: biotin/lipoyl-containing protein, partial [Gemmatimonadaceae bacterium]
MATKVFMEALSPTMEEGRLVKWLKNEGDKVASGDVLAEVETDKAIMELVARGDGVLRKRLIGENATAPVGTLIGVIAAPEEKIDDLTAAAPEKKDGATAQSAPAPAAAAQPSAPSVEPSPAKAQPQTSDLRP